jgi:hypothetical protein
VKTNLARSFQILDSCSVRLSRKATKTESWQPDFGGTLYLEGGTLSIQAWLLPSLVAGRFEGLTLKFSLSSPNPRNRKIPL